MGASRQFQRQAAKVAKSDARKMFQQAMRNGEFLEKAMKRAVNELPLRLRIVASAAILFRRWR